MLMPENILNVMIVLPVAVPVATAALLLLIRHRPRLARPVSFAGMTVLLLNNNLLTLQVLKHGMVTAQMGNWPAPAGITLAVDTFSALMLSVAAIMGFTIMIYSLVDIDGQRQRYHYHPLLHLLLMGVCGAFLTGDMFNLYVWIEVTLISSFALMTLGGERGQLEGGVKYVVLNLFSSVFLLVGVGTLYRLTGTLNMADLAVKLPEAAPPEVMTVLAMVFFVAFGIKAAVFPLFFWLPASYHRPPVAVSAIFAALLSKVGVYALIRLFTLIFIHDPGTTHTLILVVAGITMITGVLGAFSQMDFRRLLSFHIISQIGYMIMGLGFFTVWGVAGGIFYMIHNIIVKTNLFLVSGITHRLQGSFDLERMGGGYHRHPGVAVLFLIPALSLAGIPPLSGFWGKLVLVWEGLLRGHYIVTGCALFVGLLTLLSMSKIWSEAFWKAPAPQIAPQDDRRLTPREKGGLVLPVVLLALLTVLIGFYCEPLLKVALKAGRELMQPEHYISTVLGGGMQ